MASPHLAHAQSLLRFIDRSPSPYHAAASAADLLAESGFEIVKPGEPSPGPGRWMTPRDGALLAWIVPEYVDAGAPFHIVGAHTDSPNLRLKPAPNADAVGYRRLGVEVYGGVLLNSWLDRDLGLSGRIAVRGDDSVEVRLVKIDEPLFRLPQLAIHLDRGVNENGLQLNKQQHMAPIYGPSTAPELLSLVAEHDDVSARDIVGFDLMLHDTAPSQLVGFDSAFISAPRLDNQLSCHAAVTALSGTTPKGSIPVVALFDHEEVGSVSVTGAATDTLPRLLAGITTGLGGDDADHARALDSSLFVSADNAHATHPNYPERHDPGHPIVMNGGPVLKFNANQRYTTDAVSAGLFRLAAERAGVEIQSFVSRTDMACGSTIGPTVASSLGVRALDVGCAQLAMHSARELAGTNDPWDLTLILADLLG